jgi:hypothetical protein
MICSFQGKCDKRKCCKHGAMGVCYADELNDTADGSVNAAAFFP